MPNTGLNAPPTGNGTTVTVAVTGYKPDASAALLLANPLLGFLEGGPAFADVGFFGPPPYTQLLLFPSTDGNGSASFPVDLRFALTGQRYDPVIGCPVTQETADFGLGRCELIFGQFAVGSLERFVGFAGDPTPRSPTLGLSKSTAAVGDTVNLNGVRWNASPYFGSGTSQGGPGETQLKVELCKTDLSACTTQAANASVDLTRYRSSSTTVPITGVFSGTNLTGSFTVADTAGCAPTCVVRVQQQGFDPSTGGGPTGQFISATAPLTVGTAPPDGTLTCKLKTRNSGKTYLACRLNDRAGIRHVNVINATTGVREQSISFSGTTLSGVSQCASGLRCIGNRVEQSIGDFAVVVPSG